MSVLENQAWEKPGTFFHIFKSNLAGLISLNDRKIV